ncbi:MAG: ABC transporter ATP-binding protein [Spirochaetales bacterium]|nr:ABC transporter ATP-binding protein [Spirochaetales bacterium]MCR5443654.1 ABC transporter ATP-binding protein/permease [Sphaerochaetaceae bacterium]MBQ4282177.1 ABC transporter ATP-binding protein [Spirochaetales bacterium]MBQ6125362.1 ABC transporter ATP-binding protein [Spirochaetales bacterium]MBQ7282632.1 ABC transporter ATP-binding protein [Spirochaetales bacterium]
MRRLLKYARRQWKLYLTSIIFLVIGVYLNALGPKFIRDIIDTCIVGGRGDLFFSIAIPMLVVYLVTGVAKYIQEFSSDCISSAMQRCMREETFRSILAEDQYFFRENNPGELMSRTKQDIETVGFTTGFIAMFFIEIVLHVIYMAYCLISINPSGAIPALVIMPIIGVLAIISEPKGDKLSDKRSDDIADMNQSATESLSGIRTVKAFGREREEAARFDKSNRRFFRHSLKLDFLWANWITPMEALARIMLYLAILLSGIQVIRGKMTLGELSAVTSYTSELAWPMMELGWLLTEFAAARASLRKISKILDAKPRIKSGEKHLEKPSGDLEFDHVSLTADNGAVILDDVSFHLKSGRTLGIMGATGSGKSTIANLAMRFIDPTSGNIRTDGTDLRDLDLDSARCGKAIVTQDIFLFSDTITSNLDKGQKGLLSQEVLEESAKDAAAHDFISKLAEGYDTVIGEKGVGLSGGQKQRVSIARAFASGRPLLIFDDATSALDMETEKKVQRAIKHHRNLTMMIIAHRISAVRDADEIIILDHGKIVERGTHESLMALKGNYYKTYMTQYPEEEEN